MSKQSKKMDSTAIHIGPFVRLFALSVGTYAAKLGRVCSRAGGVGGGCGG